MTALFIRRCSKLRIFLHTPTRAIGNPSLHKQNNIIHKMCTKINNCAIFAGKSHKIVDKRLKKKKKQSNIK